MFGFRMHILASVDRKKTLKTLKSEHDGILWRVRRRRRGQWKSMAGEEGRGGAG